MRGRSGCETTVFGEGLATQVASQAALLVGCAMHCKLLLYDAAIGPAGRVSGQSAHAHSPTSLYLDRRNAASSKPNS